MSRDFKVIQVSTHCELVPNKSDYTFFKQKAATSCVDYSF